MKKVILSVLYVLGVAVCVFFRFFQITTMVDPQTGFLLSQYQNSNLVVFGSAGLFVLLLIILGATGDGLAYPQRSSVPQGIASIVLGCVALFLTFRLLVTVQIGTSAVSNIITVSYIVSSFIFAIFLFYYGYTRIANVAVAPYAAVIPVIFASIRLVSVFLQHYGLAKTTDSVMEIVLMIISLLFWHYFSKYIAGIKPKSTPRWVVGYALAASLMSFAVTIPTYYAKYFTAIQSVREIEDNSYFDLAVGVFIIVFLLTSIPRKSSRKVYKLGD